MTLGMPISVFFKGHGGWGDDSPHLNNFPLIPTEPVMEGAKHLTRVTLKGPRDTRHSGREESYNNIKTTGATNPLPKTSTCTKFS
jgi:hypothetical protein